MNTSLQPGGVAVSTFVYTAHATGAPVFNPARTGPARTDAQGEIATPYRIVVDETDNIEADIAEHIRLNLQDVTVRTTGSGLGGANKVRAATVRLIGGTPAYAAGRRKPEAAYADVLVTVTVGRAGDGRLPTGAQVGE